LLPESSFLPNYGYAMLSRILTLLRAIRIEAVEQDFLISPWTDILPFKQSKVPNISFKKNNEGEECAFVCYATGRALTILCCFQHTALDQSLQESAEMKALEDNEACEAFEMLVVVDNKLKVLRAMHLFTPYSLQTDSLATILSTLQAELKTTLYHFSHKEPILHIQPTQPTAVPQASPPNEFAARIHHFLSQLGFRNIRTSNSSNTTHLLIIAMIEEEEVPVAIRTFPIRFEVSRTEITIRLYFSCNNSVASFPRKHSATTSGLTRELTTLLASNYRYFYETEKMQVHLVRKLPITEVQNDTNQVLQSAYLEGIQTIKWSSEALYHHWQYPGDSLQSCYEKVCYKNPANPTYPPIQVKLPVLQYNMLIEFLETAKLRCFLTPFSPSEPGNISKLVQNLPIDYISIQEYAEKSPSDLSLTLKSALPLRLEAQKRGIPLEIDMIAVNKVNRELTLSLPREGMLDSMETSVIRSIETVKKMLNPQESSSDPINMRLKGEDFRLIARDSQWILTGELCGLQVKLFFCPPQVLAHPRLPAYLQTLGNLDFTEDFLGVMDFEGYNYLVQRYFPSQPLTLAGLKRLVDLLEGLHRQRIYHGCVSLQTICVSDTRLSLLWPAFSPAFFPLVGLVLDPDRLNYSLYPPLWAFLMYEIEPQEEDLEAADTVAVCLLGLQCCFKELPDLEVAQELQAGAQGQASLAYISRVLQRVRTEL